MHEEHDWGERAARGVFGFAFHVVLATVGTFAFGMLFSIAIGAIVPNIFKRMEFVPFVISGAALALFSVPRWCGRCAPWVGIVGLVFLGWGIQELAGSWSPTWSHQTRSDYVLSQLFCMHNDCSGTEGLYALFFWMAFLKHERIFACERNRSAVRKGQSRCIDVSFWFEPLAVHPLACSPQIASCQLLHPPRRGPHAALRHRGFLGPADPESAFGLHA
jgi:hypothetical protein